ncbi:MAG: transposase [Candidatus Accumulibacter sp.]|jgi:putative transposase|nr:transposase [Accumulibacter sp.]
MLTAHKITLDPNDKQATYMARATGCARFAYNWALAEWDRQYAAWTQNKRLPKPNQEALRRQLNRIKRERFPWMLEVTKCAPQLAIMQLGDAFKQFFAGRAPHPLFRKKGVHDCFSLSNDQFDVEGSRIRIPNLGWVRMREPLRFKGRILSAVISRAIGRWYVSITVEIEDPPRPPIPGNTSQDENQVTDERSGVVGVAVDADRLATLHTGEKVDDAKSLGRLLEKLRFLSRRLSRRVKGSKNRGKTQRQLSRLRARIGNIRNDGLHKLTTDLAWRFHTIGVEDVPMVKGLAQNRNPARHFVDEKYFEFRRQMKYKAAMHGSRIIVANRFLGSFRTCSACGYKVGELPPATREWTCPGCGARHDREWNAAINLRNYAVSSTVSACGEEGAASGRETGAVLASMKQESDGKPVSERNRSETFA